MTHDFGFVTLDLADVYERDQGVYTCKAFNQAGEAFTSTTIYCTGDVCASVCVFIIADYFIFSIYGIYEENFDLFDLT